MSETSTDNTAQPEQWERRLYVCKGKRLLDDTPHVVLAPIDGTGQIAGDDKYFELSKKNKARLTFYAGNIYSMEATHDHIRSTTSKYEGHWPDAADIARWQSDTRLMEMTIEAERLDRKQGERDRLAEALLPWRKQYNRTIGTARRLALDLMVLHALHTAPRDKEANRDE